MPPPILLAHRRACRLAKERKSGEVAWLRPDSKTQVSVVYEDGVPVQVSDVLVSTQHTSEVGQAEIREYVTRSLEPSILGDWMTEERRFQANPTGSFVHGSSRCERDRNERKINV